MAVCLIISLLAEFRFKAFPSADRPDCVSVPLRGLYLCCASVDVLLCRERERNGPDMSSKCIVERRDENVGELGAYIALGVRVHRLSPAYASSLCILSCVCYT